MRVNLSLSHWERGVWRVVLCLLGVLYSIAADAQMSTTAPAHPAAAGPAAGCNLALAGRVADHETGQLLPGATARLLETNDVSAADEFGNYHFHVCPGLYHLEISFVGYRPETVEVRVSSATVRNFQLHPDAVLLQGALVRGQRVAAPVPQATATLSGSALQATRGQALGEALLKVSGVSAIQTGPSVFKPMIHGLHSNRVALFNNGVRQEGQQWGQEHGPEIDPFVAARLTVVKGAAAVRYGADAMGGVVLAEPAALPDSAGVSGEGHLVGASNNGLGAASFTLQGTAKQVPGLAGRVVGTVRRAGSAATPDYRIANSGLAEYSYAGTLGYERERWGTELFFSQYNARLGLYPLPENARAAQRNTPRVAQDFTYAINRGYQDLQHTLLKLRSFYRLGERNGRLELTVAQQWDDRSEYDKFRPRNDATAARNLPELDYRNATSTAELRWEPKPWGSVSGELGLSGTYQNNTYRPGSRFFMPYYTNQALGLYGLGRWHPGARWLLEAGLRLDRRLLNTKRPTRPAGVFTVVEEDYGYFTPAASLGAMWDASPHVTLRADVSLNQRAPAANERASQGVHGGIYEEGYDISRLPGAPPLTPETARGLSLTASWHDNPRFNGEVTLYQTSFDGYIYQTPIPEVLSVRGLFPSFRYQQTDARFRGADLLATFRLLPVLTLGVKAATVWERDITKDDYLILAPADRAETWLRYEQRASAAPRRVSGFYAQVGVQAVARQARTPRPENGQDYQDPPAGYTLLNAEAGLVAGAATRHPLSLSVSGTNLLNTRYRDYLNRYRYYLDELGRNVTVRLKLNF
ncbi:TonB-dependent receptor [Hymenobacter sp. BT175]|uniref:TonB-dependent receptor n=1 Tax=Hymenobacter translucens TaxID=2886507 RepID=UPI001D0E76A5|nr:TonB-dependent receptor [Hymenobacter translucens]MCC2548189.1 TonB-dependent receptor [Hymenobacter translucens]